MGLFDRRRGSRWHSEGLQAANRGTRATNRGTLVAALVGFVSIAVTVGIYQLQERDPRHVPYFSGTIDHYAGVLPLWQFLNSHEGERVRLQITYIWASALDGSRGLPDRGQFFFPHGDRREVRFIVRDTYFGGGQEIPDSVPEKEPLGSVLVLSLYDQAIGAEDPYLELDEGVGGALDGYFRVVRWYDLEFMETVVELRPISVEDL